jgi:site-specific DNA-methyltransferase (adenine-specific)
MKALPAGCVDAVITDLPYGITSNKWDSVIPLGSLWLHLVRAGKASCAFLFTASQPFSSALVMSRPEWFRHEWIWIKNRGSNFANTVREPMKEHESVLMFSAGSWTYNRQMQERAEGGKARAKYEVAHDLDSCKDSENYRQFEGRTRHVIPETRVPSSWQKFNIEVGLHPTQKPVPLFEYLIRTYTNASEFVLDVASGSGTTAVAAKKLGRHFVGFEISPEYCKIAEERIALVEAQPNLFEKKAEQLVLSR